MQALLLGLALLMVSALPLTAQSQAEILVAAMQDGNKVIYIRHAASNAEEKDSGRLGDRAGQRNLSAAGIAQAKALGNAFRSLQIPMGQILVSPVFRARDTGELAFGADRIEVTMDLVAEEYAGPALDAMLGATRRLIRTVTPPGDNRILIGHRPALEKVVKRSFPDAILPEGAMAVFVPTGIANEPRLLGTITAERLVQSATVRR